MVRDRLMTVDEAKDAVGEELRTSNENQLAQQVTDPVLGVTAPLREILGMRMRSDTYFLPEEMRWTYKEINVSNSNNNDNRIKNIVNKTGGRKTRKHKARGHKKSRRHTKSRKH